MRKQPSKKLHLGKIKIASLSNSKQELKGGKTVSVKITCASQGAEICSDDSCRF